MGLFDRTLGSVGRKAGVNAALVTLVPNGTAAFPNLRYESFVREGYQKNELVFAIIEEWATDIAEPELRVYRDVDGEKEVADDQSALELFRHPNPYMSGDDFLGALEMFKRLAGNAYEYKVRSRGQKVVERWLLRPDRVTIIPDPDTYIKRYEYRLGAQKFDLDPADVVHHRTRNPYDDYYGMPMFVPASGRIDIDNYMRDMIKGFLQNSGMPAGILQVMGKVDEGERALIRGHFRNEFGGANSGNIMIADGGSEAPKFTPLSMPLGARGLVVPELDEMDEARIIMVGRVPMSLIGARLSQVHSTLGQSGREADRAFFSEQELVPEWKSIASTQTMGYREDLLGEGEYLDFDVSTVRSLGENEDTRSARLLSQLKEVALSIQEARQELGKGDPKPDDIFMVPIGVVPTRWADIIAPPEPVIQQVQVPADNPDQLPNGNKPALPEPKKMLGDGRPLVVNVIGSGKVRREFEYDTEGNLVASNESPVD